MTKFSFEVPLDHLEDFHDLQDYYFTLSMLYKDRRYQDHIERVQEDALHTIWIDNSFNEKFTADNPYDLVALYEQYDAQRVIAPDDIHWDTAGILKSFLDIAEMMPRKDVVCVVKDQKMLEYLYDSGCTNFAVSYWNRKATDFEHLDNKHFLGLLSVEEIIRHKPPSCDTSMPVKLALRNQTIDDWTREGSPHINTKDLGHQGRDFFNTRMTTQQIDLARRNICRLKEAVDKGICPVNDR